MLLITNTLWTLKDGARKMTSIRQKGLSEEDQLSLCPNIIWQILSLKGDYITILRCLKAQGGVGRCTFREQNFKDMTEVITQR